MIRIFIKFTALLAFTAFMISGCSGSLRTTWVNFNSYYNTFYNANRSYDRGYQQFEDQVETINYERPIRAHRAPLRAGRTDFEDAIDRGSDLLISFPTSKYVDDSVFLIGRSYYFLENFFNAEQKFMELIRITDSNDLRQQAVIWRARVMLDLDRHSEAVNYLSAQFDSPDIEWGRRERAEAELLLAQHLVELNMWNEAGEVLYDAVPNIRDRRLRARGYLLHGQILEYLEEYEAAYDAYNRVRRNNPPYQLIYIADLKNGIMLRKAGDLDRSYRHLISMSRNNNNFDNLPQINHQIGRTLQEMGRAGEAMSYYREVLYHSYRTPQRQTLANVHYGMAELYRYDFRDYNLAAAHYDSAARNASDLELLPIGFDAQPLSRSFNEFARLDNDAQKMDSLLWLGNLPPARFDSVIAKIQEDYRREMQRAARERQRDSGRIVTIDPDEIEEATEGGENGFLFHLNRQLMNQSSIQFQALWGGRPLVDNWRRQEAVRMATLAAEEDEELAEEIVYVDEVDPNDFELDLSEIPRTRRAREEMTEDLARTRYEIGNVYFVSLNMPDSAKSTFRDVIDNFNETQIAPQAMYSLSELYYISGDTLNARQWAQLIAEKHPTTIYAERLNSRFDLGIELDEITLAPKEQRIQEYYQLLDEIRESNDNVENAEKLFAFAESDTLTSYAPEAYLNAANMYITQARSDTTFAERLDIFKQQQEEIEIQQEKVTMMRDSANVVLADTAISAEDREFWGAWADSTYQEPDLRPLFPYTGEYWDQARASLEKIRERFPQYQRMARVTRLYQEIELPPEDEPEVEIEPGEEPGEEPEEWPEADESQVYECLEVGLEPVVKGGMDAFIEQSDIKEQMTEMNVLEAVFSFRVTISAEGETEQAFSLDEEDEFGFANHLIQNMTENLHFEPLIHQGLRISAICEITIPVSVLDQDEDEEQE